MITQYKKDIDIYKLITINLIIRSCFKFIEKYYYHFKQICSGHIEPLSRILNPLIFVNSPLLTAYLGLQSAST